MHNHIRKFPVAVIGIVEHLSEVDGSLALTVATYLGIKAPKGQDSTKVGKAKGLSQEQGATDTIKTRKIAILVADGMNAADVTRMQSGLKKSGATSEVIAPHLAISQGTLR